MRVIAGEAKHIPLVAPKGFDTRPTTDKIKETLFNILNFQIPGCSFLDLFSGTGAIGIEAKSRGASKVVLVENGKEAIKSIATNLTKTKYQDSIELITQDVFYALKLLNAKKCKFDIIFLDPPYDEKKEEKTIELISKLDLLEEDGMIIAEALSKTEFSFVEDFGLKVKREKDYKHIKHVFITK